MFSLPLPSYQQPNGSKSNSSSTKKRKRKALPTPEGPATQDVKITDKHAGFLGRHFPSQQSAFSAVLTPDEIYQYAVAGQAVEDELHAHHFPHADSDNKKGNSKFDYDLGQRLWPGIASPSKRDSASIVRSLHQQHLAVMTTILHRALLEEDFVRAGRALGMILRDETGGKPIDVRAQGRWGMGAEILMRQDAQRQYRSREQPRTSSGEPERISERPRAWFTRKGFEDAKKYYERLIVQYPFYKQNPGAVSALDFYPAMFGLWIYVVHHEAKLKSLEPSSEGDDSDGEKERPDTTASRVMQTTSRYQPGVEELSQAKEIADRMDSVMGALPFRESADLIELRRMVRLWIDDLEETTMKEDVMDEREDTPMEFLTSGVTNVSLQSEI